MKLKKCYRELLRKHLNNKNQMLLRNHDFTIISSNCVGGIIYHELGERFLSPTITLWFEPNDFLKFASNFDFYLSQDLIEIVNEKSYPVGKLADIRVYFMHYDSFQDAKEKWIERCKRINRSNVYVIMTQSQEMCDEYVYRFDELPYNNKVKLTEKEFIDIKSAYHVPMSRKKDGIYDLCMYKSKFTGKRWLDDFNYVDFLNKR